MCSNMSGKAENDGAKEAAQRAKGRKQPRPPNPAPKVSASQQEKSGAPTAARRVTRSRSLVIERGAALEDPGPPTSGPALRAECGGGSPERAKSSKEDPSVPDGEGWTLSCSSRSRKRLQALKSVSDVTEGPSPPHNHGVGGRPKTVTFSAGAEAKPSKKTKQTDAPVGGAHQQGLSEGGRKKTATTSSGAEKLPTGAKPKQAGKAAKKSTKSKELGRTGEVVQTADPRPAEPPLTRKPEPVQTPVLRVLQEMKDLIGGLDALLADGKGGASAGSSVSLQEKLSDVLPALSDKLRLVTAHCSEQSRLEDKVELLLLGASPLASALAPRKTYADMAKASAVPVSIGASAKIFRVEVFPAVPDSKSTSDHTKEKLLRGVKPVDFGFHPTRVKRNPRNGSVVVESSSANVLKMVGAPSLTQAGLRAAESKRRRPHLSVFGVSRKLTEEQITEAIRSQNGVNWTDTSYAKPAYRFGARDRPTTNWSVEVSPDVRLALLRNGKIGIGWSMCSVEDRLRPVSCRKCCRYGHTAARCREAEPVCGHCAARTHESRECPTREDQSLRSCGPCALYSKRPAPHRHQFDTEACPEHMKRIRELAQETDYGY